MAKKKLEKVDGLGPVDAKRLVTAIRRVWSWNYARRLCIERAELTTEPGADPMYRCERCGASVPKVYPDHKKPVGEFDPFRYLTRMFVSSRDLQALCKQCHRLKTNRERREGKK